MLVIGAISAIWGTWVYHDDGAFREHSAGLVRATIYVYYSDRSSSAALMSRMPHRGWRFHGESAVGTPIVEWRPSFTSQGPPLPSWAVRVPLWVPFLLLAGPAARMWWKHATRPPHTCESCGYDLRGTPGPTCPECGTSRGVPIP